MNEISNFNAFLESLGDKLDKRTVCIQKREDSDFYDVVCSCCTNTISEGFTEEEEAVDYCSEFGYTIVEKPGIYLKDGTKIL